MSCMIMNRMIDFYLTVLLVMEKSKQTGEMTN